MSRGLNRAQIIGHLGQDPELRYTGSGTAVCNFSVATNQYDRDEPEWHRVTAWEQLAEICNEHLSKGEKVFVEGSLRTREWEDNDGHARQTTEIHAAEVLFLGSEQPSSSRQASGSANGQPQKEPASGGQDQFEPSDELPF